MEFIAQLFRDFDIEISKIRTIEDWSLNSNTIVYNIYHTALRNSGIDISMHRWNIESNGLASGLYIDDNLIGSYEDSEDIKLKDNERDNIS